VSHIKIAVISDLHLNKIDPVKQYEHLEQFRKDMEEWQPDLIIENGDAFDAETSMRDSAAAIFNRVFHDFKTMSGTFVSIDGTYSHDKNQKRAYKHLVDDNFRLISKATVEYVLGMKILFIPEEYMINPKEYYDYFLNPEGKYDFVFGHGTFSHMGFGSVDMRNVKRKLAAPMFKYEDFKDIVHGNVYFGHNHKPHVYENIISVGSYDRLAHNEEEAKGYWKIKYDVKNRRIVSNDHIENKLAFKFKTFLEEDLPLDTEDLLKFVEEKSKDCYKSRIVLNNTVTQDRVNQLVSVVQSRPTMGLTDKREKVRKKKIAKGELSDEHIKSETNKYKNMNWDDALSLYIKDMKGIVFSSKEINEAIFN